MPSRRQAKSEAANAIDMESAKASLEVSKQLAAGDIIQVKPFGGGTQFKVTGIEACAGSFIEGEELEGIRVWKNP